MSYLYLRPRLSFNVLRYLSHSFLTLFFFLVTLCSVAQNYTISGTVKDASNGEDLIGVLIGVTEMPGIGTATNSYGFFSLTLPQGNYAIMFQSLGYVIWNERIELKSNLALKVELKSATSELSEVQITDSRSNDNVRKNEMGVMKIDPKAVESVPVLFGERDIIKIFQMTPGVKSAGEGNAGFFVRGGSADQNLILLDEAPVYNASHLLGFFSVFNSDALKDVTLYKGGMPAEYGGRSSSVMDIKMKDGNAKTFGAQGGIGLIASRLTLEAPIVKDRGSFIVSGRRTYADMFLKLSKDSVTKESSLYFYDLNVKANYRINDKNRIYLSGYFGRDNFGLGDIFGFDWGNKTSTLRLNHIFNERLFSNTSLIYSDYSYRFSFSPSGNTIRFSSSIKDFNLKQDFSFFPNPNHKIKFGLNTIHHTFVPGEISSDIPSFSDLKLTNKYALENAVYVQDDMSINERVGLQYGLRYSFFDYMGAGTAYTFDEEGNVITSTDYAQWQTIKTYGGFEPRLALRYDLKKNSSLKASYNRSLQYLHLLSNSTSSQPTDIWVPSSNNIKPQTSNQASIGYFRNFKDNTYELSLETYYKTMNNAIDYRNGANLFFNDQAEGELVYGKGRAYGVELLFRRQTGKLTGWVSYTWSRSLRTFDDINDGSEFAAKQDRIHDVAIVAMYALSDRVKLAANWIYYTGAAVTFPSGKYEVEGITVPLYSERNGYRMPEYHRLDIGVTVDAKTKNPKFESSWNFSAYNAYARRNAYAITFQQNEDNPEQTQAVRTTLFRIVPSITYNFKF